MTNALRCLLAAVFFIAADVVFATEWVLRKILNALVKLGVWLQQI